MLPDLVSLALFVRAVDTKSLSKAAEQSHIALAAANCARSFGRCCVIADVFALMRMCPLTPLA